MAGEKGPDPLQDAVRGTIEGYTPQVRDWMEDRPGAWGFLAGKAVVAYRQGLGRGLTDLERRRVWHLLWGTLSALKGRRRGGEGAGLLADDRLHDP
ncbi:MAG: hypothetical protein J4F43_01225 [Dehalococcoidia bacterium]|nr:hypothetical protein [Dehalococcoidia bacterium]